MTATSPLAAQLGAILTRARGTESRRALAGRLKVSDPALTAVEQGRNNPTLARIESLADGYGARVALVDVDALTDAIAAGLVQASSYDGPLTPKRADTAARRIAATITNPQEPTP